MSDSDRMSQTITNNPINSEEAKNTENNVMEATNNAVKLLKINYPNNVIVIETFLSKNDINDKLKEYFPNILDVGTNLYTKIKLTKKGRPNLACQRGIEPDGGLVFMIDSNTKNKYLLGIIEDKTQGTNARRIARGDKPNTASGNAVERAYKNIREIENYLRNEDIHPYLIFASGEDFEDENSSIRERCTAMTNHSPFNKLYINNIIDKYGNASRRTSFFIGIKGIEAMNNIIYEMLEISIKYYFNKYTEILNDNK